MAPGDELILTVEGRPVAVVTRSTPVGDHACEPGSANATPLWMAKDFDAPLDDFADYME
jgi:antitoxin (DNA-binding transcriptional repressor) of toxin-antitoxin stability system